MRSKTQEKVLRVLLKALKPLVHLLLEVGIGHREFSEIAKRAFVDVATQKYGIRGRKTNISRVAVMTGLTRKEVKRIRDDGTDTFSPSSVKPVPAALVLQHWHTDPDYLTVNGIPREIPFVGDTGSFSSLVKKYAGDIPPGALRTELVRSGAMVVTEEGHLLAKRRTFRFVDSEEQLLWCFDRWVFGVNLNITHNYMQKKTDKVSANPTWPNRVTEALRVRRSDVPAIREYVRECATRFTEEIDDRMTPHETKNADHGGNELVDVFAGLIYHEFPSTDKV